MTRLHCLAALAVLVANVHLGICQADEKTFSVSPGAWVATGIEIKPGQFFEIAAKGILKHPGGRESGPDGYYWLGFQAWTLKYRIGEHPPNEGVRDAGSGATGFGGEKGGQLYLGVSGTYDPLPAESTVSGSLEVTVSFGESSNIDLGGNTGGGLLPGVQPPVSSSADGKGPRRGTSPLWPGLIPPLVVSLVNVRDLINRRRPKKPKSDGPLTTSVRESLPGVPPEDPPYVRDNPRDRTPAPCRQFYDDYVAAQKEITAMEGPIRIATETYWEAQRRLNQNLAKFSIQLAWDTADLASAGAGGIKGAMGIATLITQIPDALRKGLQLARSAASKAARKVGQLTEAVAELARRAKAALQNADQLAARGKSLAASVDELAGAVSAAEKQMAEQLRFLKFLDEADGLAAQRGVIAKELAEAEARVAKARELADSNQKRLAAIPDEQVALGGQIDSAVVELREALADCTAQEHKAAARTAAAQEPYRKCDARVRDLDPRVKKLRELDGLQKKFLAAETAFDNAEQELKQATRELEQVHQTFNQQARIIAIREELKSSTEWLADAKKNFHEASRNWNGAVRRRDDFLETLPTDEMGAPDPGQLNATQRASLAAHERECFLLESDYQQAKLAHTEAEQRFIKARTAALDLPENLGDDAMQAGAARLAAARAKVAEKDAKLARCNEDYQKASRDVQGLAHPGMDLRELPALEAELAELKQQWPGLKQALDEAFDAEVALKPALQERRAAAESIRQRISDLETREKALKEELKRCNLDQNRHAVWEEKQATKISELKAKDQTLEKKHGEARDRVPAGATRESLQREIAAHRDAIAANNKRIAELRKELDEGVQPIADARKLANTTEAERVAKIRELDQAEEDQRKAEEELKRLEGELEKHANDPDLIDRIRNNSKDWSNRVKPGFVKDFEGWVKGKAATLGGLWEKAFGGQSPEEVAQILKHGHDTVQRRLNELNELLADRDELMGALRGLRGQLEMCKVQYASAEQPQ